MYIPYSVYITIHDSSVCLKRVGGEVVVVSGLFVMKLC